MRQEHKLPNNEGQMEVCKACHSIERDTKQSSLRISEESSSDFQRSIVLGSFAKARNDEIYISRIYISREHLRQNCQ